MQRVLCAVLAVAALGGPALAGPAQSGRKPDFSGSWTMNAAKSTFGVVPPPASITRKITHAEPAMAIEEVQDSPLGVQETTRKYQTDGSETTFSAQGADVKTSAKWEGDVLVVISTVEMIGISYNDRMSLSPDGKTLTSTIAIGSPQGNVDVVVVFDKQ